MIIDRIIREEKKALSLKVDSSIHKDLNLYIEYYKEVFKEDINMNEVAENLLSAVLVKDKKFQAFKKNK